MTMGFKKCFDFWTTQISQMSNVLKDLGHFVNNLIMKIYFKKSNSKQSLTVLFYTESSE